MKEIILKDYGWCKILKRDQSYFIYFDEGQIVIRMNCYPISEQEASLAIENEIEAEKIARSAKKKNK